MIANNSAIQHHSSRVLLSSSSRPRDISRPSYEAKDPFVDIHQPRFNSILAAERDQQNKIDKQTQINIHQIYRLQRMKPKLLQNSPDLAIWIKNKNRYKDARASLKLAKQLK
ncbi:hypothetical protein Nepgr_007798 [Nepenthes gracilis]|uniref:Uncharacterized protein n=1 Tax=Nepenthes gracilis TaxID=150966 RepID=A0AAD3S7I2_NEPGR|nr:hypothetical protein Nepgr_007798 [Nepenthes gracilis]